MAIKAILTGQSSSNRGIYYFEINDEGHLICHYSGVVAPNFYINESGHLIYEED